MARQPFRDRRRRKGNIVVLTAFLMIGLLAMIAFAVDVGFLCVTRQQLQRSADSAALAACWELIDQQAPTGQSSPDVMQSNVQATASEFAGLNEVLMSSPEVLPGDIQIGYLENPSDPTCPMVTGGGDAPNAVRVRIRRSDEVNSAAPLFFARVLGQREVQLQAEATSALLTNIRGFRIPPQGKTVGILPFALDETTCNNMLNGYGDDKWQLTNGEVKLGSDGAHEVNLYPQGTGSPGNRGTVDIGNNNNSTKDISRQITDGVSEADLAACGGKLEISADTGVLFLNGDTGISAGVKDELASIIGDPKILPVFREVTGNGNNAIYSIVDFVGVRILDVKLTGSVSSKRVTIQPACKVTYGAIADTSGSSLGHYIYSLPWLVR
ncbi:MAG: pilus assembly protein TadG-related protein [Pirellulaceae bacterium]